jgi:hypothetical protein
VKKRRQINRLQKFAAWAVVAAMVLFAGGGILVYFFEARRQPPAARSDVSRDEVLARVQTFPDQGVNHIPDGTKINSYNSNPPTSGPHYAKPADWGIYDTELPDERLVHNLEHCGIWISYRPDISEEEKAKIVAYAKGFPTKIIVTPRAKNDAAISLAAWRHLLTMDQFSEREADIFISAFLNKAGPECNAN